MNKIVICFLLYAFSSNAFTISGKIIDAATNEPIGHVNVYLANTMMGTVSNAEGNYEFTARPGTYSLVASFMGFEPGIQQVHITDYNKVVNFRLVERPIEMPEVTISASQVRLFQRRLQLFKKLFLGQTENAKQCFILNPEVLTFDQIGGYLIADSDVPLKVRNNALGFEINIIIQKFKWTKVDVGGAYITHPQFIDLSENADDAQQKIWRENRLATYKNSSREFFSNLYHHEHSGDFSYAWRDESDGGYSMLMKDCRYFQVDTLKLYDFRQLNIRHDYLKVASPNRRQTELKLKTDHIVIDKYGLVINYDAFTMSGYWGELRMADTLPQDYTPDEL